MPSSPEDSNFATDDNVSTSSTGQPAQYAEAIPSSHSSDDSSSGHLEDNELLNLPPPIVDDSDEDPTFLPERPQRQRSKAGADEPQDDSSSGPDAVQLSQPLTHVYEDRPNRFLGPSSTWYTWTKEERNITSFLSNEQATDLSAHLFNAFALKSRARQHRISVTTGEATDAADYDAYFKPPKVWTAWPLPPEEVPRESQKLIWDPSDPMSYRTSPDLRPSVDLEETCIAMGLHFAKEMFNNRNTDFSTAESDLKGTISPSNSSGGTMQDVIIKADEIPADPPRIAESSNNSDFLFDEVYTSQPYESIGQTDDGDRINDRQEAVHENVPPMFMADDDDARSILRPITRDMLSRLDRLLFNLHTIRSSYATQGSNIRLKRSSKTDTAAVASVSSSASPRKKDTRLSHTVSRAETSDSASSSHERRTKNMRSSHRTPHDVQISRLALRDWSEILGTASITDWTPDVVGQASERCAALFREDMLFRTFYEGDNSGKKSETAHFIEQTASGREPVKNAEAALHPTGWFTEPGSENEIELDTEIENDGPHDFHCVVRDCDRRHRPFPNWYQLQKHIKDFHRVRRGPKSRSDELPSTSGTDFAETEVEDTTYGDDAYACPVASCNRAQKLFSRLPNLYSHIRKQHRTFDVEKFKKLQSQKRSERRGRQNDHKRRRNRLPRDHAISGSHK